MSQFTKKEQVLDLVVDSAEIVRMIGRSIEKGKVDPASAINNLASNTTEQTQDIVGAMFSSNTETRISATYEDSDGTIDLVVDDMTANTTYSISAADGDNTDEEKIRLSGNPEIGYLPKDILKRRQEREQMYKPGGKLYDVYKKYTESE